jgi:pyruvate ferredoxin oxidoreductase alpha subunit
VVALGSVLGTIDDVIDELRDEGVSIGSLAIKCFRPYPLEEVRAVLARAQRVIVLEKAMAVGIGGIVGQNVRYTLADAKLPVYDVIAGLGGRPITKASLRGLFESALKDELRPLTFLDLNRELVERELERSRELERPGPHAENILRDLGIVAASPI